MKVIPAIDLRGGKCVRLIQGEYHRQITYKDDPVAQAKDFMAAGATHLHIVDLDGARVGTPINTEAVQAIVQAVDMNVELGGGIRDEQSIRRMIDMGIDQVIIGTQAISRFDWFSQMAKEFPDRLILSLDARGSKVSIEGWTQQSQQKLWDFAAQAAELPLAAIIYTDISKDGMMEGPNFERTKTLVDSVDIPVICAGGVTEVSDIIRLKELGVGAAIIGRALYEGRIDLKDALAAAR